MKPLVLVVDDEHAFREVVCEILEAAGYRAQRASHVKEAFQRLAEEIPDLILTDVMMPDVDGLTFIRELRSDPLWADIPLIVVTAKAGASDQQAAMEAGADSYLSKPFSSADLEMLVNSFLRVA